MCSGSRRSTASGGVLATTRQVTGVAFWGSWRTYLLELPGRGSEQLAAMTLTDGADCSSSKDAVEKGDSRELDWAEGVADQASRAADQERGMDLDPEDGRGPISVADNACQSGPSTVVNGVTEEENFGAPAEVVEGELTLSCAL